MSKSRSSISFSVRRHFVDNFFLSHKDSFQEGTKIIDIGGKRINKRGLFNIDDFNKSVTYVNIEPETEPDILADATNIPLENNSCDLILMGELLEHVSDPRLVLKEAYRLLRPGGVLLVTVPFMMGVHGDPSDYGRYTDSFWKLTSKDLGFTEIKIESQGTMFAVFALMVQHIFRAKNRSWKPVQSFIISFLMWIDKRTSHPLLRAWTTGYGFKMVK